MAEGGGLGTGAIFFRWDRGKGETRLSKACRGEGMQMNDHHMHGSQPAAPVLLVSLSSTMLQVYVGALLEIETVGGAPQLEVEIW